jgi:prepilin-type processing-associated H-X9-DG protein
VTNRLRNLLLGLAAVLLLLVSSACLGIPLLGVDVAFLLAAGWVPYLLRVVPQVTVRWDLVASTAAYVAALAVGAHLFLRWLQRESVNADGASAPAWKWRWTLGGLSLVLLMFVAGTAMVGIVHQTAWLVRSPEPMYRRGSPRRNQAVCTRNLVYIGQALQAYARDNGGRFPDDLRELVLRDDVQNHILVCPGSDDEYAPGDTPEEHAAALATGRHNSYVYLGKGVAHGPDGRPDAKRVVVVEPLENHDGSGMNALYADGRTEWLDRPAAERVLEGLGFERVEPPRRR